TYHAWVRDAQGCERLIRDNIVLDVPEAIVAAIQVTRDNCTNLQGEITVDLPMGGQGSNYTYQLIKDGVNLRAPQNTRVFSGLGAGEYEVLITDQWGCSLNTPSEFLYEQLDVSTSVVKSIDCTVTPEGEITVNVNGGSTNLEFIMTTPLGNVITQITGVFTNLTEAGTYSIIVRDNDTTNPVCERTVTQELDAPIDPVLIDATINNVSCFSGNNGSIRVNIDPATDTNPLYQYELYDIVNLVTPIAGPQTDPLFTNLNAGDYQIKVISGRGCVGFRNETITEPTELLIDATATTFACDGDNGVTTSTITIAILDGVTTPGNPSGTPQYLYSINNVNFQSSNTFEILDNGLTRNIIVYVTDGQSCPATTSVTIEPLNKFSATVSQISAISCTNEEVVTVAVTDDGNPHNYSFELLPLGNPNGAQTAFTSTTATFDLSSVGNYTFRVTDMDTGCYVDTTSYEIAPYNFIDVMAVAITPVTCFGDGNGALEISITGYAGNYDYQLFDGLGNTVGGLVSTDTSVNPRPITGLAGGNYYVRVTETGVPSCIEDSNIVNIISPDTALTAIVDALAVPTCTNDQGEILIDPSGGYAPYDIVLTNTTTSQVYSVMDVHAITFAGLSAGSFTISVTDDLGCVYTDTEMLNAAIPIVANATPLITDLACSGDTGVTISANVTSGGSGTYEYQLNRYNSAGTAIIYTTGEQLSPDFNDMGAGIYSITVTDGWNCDIETNRVEIRQPTLVEALLIRTDPLTCATGVEFELSAAGGSGSYEYSVDNLTFVPMSSNPMALPSIGTFASGTYQYYVRDAVNVCEAILSNAITEDAIDPLILLVDETAATINCNGESTAIIFADAYGGLGNYQYELFTDASLSIASRIAGPQARGEFRDLPAGNYYVSVTSFDCTTAPEEVTITDPEPLSYSEVVSDASCFGEENGSITVTLSGGSGDYLYSISPNLAQFDSINTFTNLAPGDYVVIAQDRNGCFEYIEYTISQPTMINVSATTSPEICAGSNDGSISLAISGGTAPYSTAVNSNVDADFVQGRTELTDLAEGNYILFVRDNNGCETNLTVTIDPGVNLNAEVIPVYECTGNMPTNYIDVVLEDSENSSEVLYALDSSNTNDMLLNPDFRNLAPGPHYITIAHANGCVNIIDFEIENFEPLNLTLQQNNINEITAVATGGRKDYTFYFDDTNNGTDNTFYITRTDNYTVTVVDENGCESTASIFVEFIDIEITNFFTPDGDGQNDRWKPKNIDQFPEILIKIFDRYGREVSRVSVDVQGWDGTYKKAELPTGDYWYVIQLNGEDDDREFVGHFTLYR
ncbi:T9SS type B sorting domain-containing protein, partial [Kriegella aquimaris]